MASSRMTSSCVKSAPLARPSVRQPTTLPRTRNGKESKGFTSVRLVWARWAAVMAAEAAGKKENSCRRAVLKSAVPHSRHTSANCVRGRRFPAFSSTSSLSPIMGAARSYTSTWDMTQDHTGSEQVFTTGCTSRSLLYVPCHNLPARAFGERWRRSAWSFCLCGGQEISTSWGHATERRKNNRDAAARYD